MISNSGLIRVFVLFIIIVTVCVITVLIVKNKWSNEQFSNVSSLPTVPTLAGKTGKTSRTLYKTSNNFPLDLAAEKDVLDDKRDLLQMFSCVSIDDKMLTFLPTILSASPYYIDSFEVLTTNFNTDVKGRITSSIQALAQQQPNQKALLPIYALISQAPYYPDVNGGMISLINFNIESGYNNQPYNTTVSPPQTQPLLVSVYLVYFMHGKNKQPLPNITTNTINNFLDQFLKTATKDPLCYINCIGDTSSFCGCKTVQTEYTEMQNVSVPYTATCLGPTEQTNAITYSIVYSINANYPAIAGIVQFGNINITPIIPGVFKYPPDMVTSFTPDSVVTVQGLNSQVNVSYISKISGLAYGNGQYRVWSNSVNNTNSGWNPANLFIEHSVNGYITYQADCTFTNTTVNTNPALAPYVAIELPDVITLDSYTLTAPSTVIQAPTSFIVYGSIDNISWVKIDKQVNVNWNTNKKRFITVSDTPFSMFKFEFYANSSQSATCISLQNIALHGSPIYSANTPLTSLSGK